MSQAKNRTGRRDSIRFPFPVSCRVDALLKGRLFVEELETREVPAVVTPGYILESSSSSGGVGAFGSPGPTGLSPAAIRHAYGFDQVSYNGAGTTIAIVDAYDDPTIASDLHAFDLQFGLNDPTFTKVNQNGGTTMPAANTGWAGEISLDVEWAHAIAPAANILLVEANSASYSDLLTAVDYAARQTGVVAVSMSWGGGEFSSETSLDSHFLTPTGHTGVVFVASSGDSGAPTSYPSVSPYVLSVGGTSLHLGTGSTYSSESTWSGSGGGISTYENQPTYQNGIVTQSTTKRTNPDVAYDSDPNTGFSVYQTYGNSSSAPWLQYGGTSDAAPQWAALIALADQGRVAVGEAALSSTTLLPMIYQLPSADFHDVTSGTSTGSPNYTAGTGYDLTTGRGTPIANKVITDLIGSSAATATHFALTTPTTATAGTAFTVTVTAQDASNATVTGFTGTVHFTSNDALAGLPADYTFTAADHGVHTFTVTLKTAGNKSVSATSGSASGSGTITVNPSTPTHLGFGQQPTNVTVGATISPAVTVRELDAYGNVATQDSTTQIALALGSNPGGATLTGGGAVTVSHGVATFNALSLNQAGNSYTLVASGGSLTGATSASFNATTTSSTTATHFSVSAPSTATAGSPFSVTVTALDASNATVTGFTGTVHFTSSASQSVLPADYTFTTADGGRHTFTVTLKTAGYQSVTATSGTIRGSSSTITITSSTPTHLGFFQQPTNAVAGATISPAVTVRELDAYGNVATQDNTTQILLTLGTNPGGATLTGGGPVTVSHGVATFSGLSLNKAGTGYKLVASGGSLTGTTSTAFNVTTSSSTAIETFENGLGNYYYMGSASPQVTTSVAAAHDGSLGLLNAGDGNWYLRLDNSAKINPGDTVSVWTQLAGTADGRAYFGFGTTTSGTLSAVLAPNTGQLVIQNNAGYGYTDLASVSQSYLANHWYRLEVAWGTSGAVTVRLYDSNGTTLLNSVTAVTGDVTPGDFAFRAIGSTKDWDTVTVTRAVNSFTAQAIPQMPATIPTTPSSPTRTGNSVQPTPPYTEFGWAVMVSSSSGSPSTGMQPNTHGVTSPEIFLPPSLFGDSWGNEDILGDWTHHKHQ